jgi:hypothetical protein
MFFEFANAAARLFEPVGLPMNFGLGCFGVAAITHLSRDLEHVVESLDRDQQREHRRELPNDRVGQPVIRAALDEAADLLRPEALERHDLRVVVDEVVDVRCLSS